MIQIAAHVSFGLITAGMVLSIYRLIRGPSLPDRVVALDLIGILSLGIIVTATISNNDPVLLDVAIVLGLIAFMGTVAFARYLERVGQ